MSNELEIQDIPDFLKEFTIEDPATKVDNLEEEKQEVLEAMTPGEDSIQDLESLKKDLETQDEEKPEVEEDDVVTKSTDEVEYSFKPFIETMAEYGVLDLEEGEEFEDSAEVLVEKFENTVNTRVNKGIDEYKESIPELGKQFLDYLEKGGDPRKFIEVQASEIDLVSLDLTDEDNQKLVIKEYLKSQDYSNEEINETLQDYEDGLLLEKQAKLAAKKLEKFNQGKAELLVQEQEKEAQRIESQIQEYVTGVQSFIKGSTEIAGLAIADTEKRVFEDYLFKKGKDGLTQYQRDINEDPQKTQVELAFLKFKKYDFAKVAKKAESNAAAKIRKSVLAKNETTVKGASQETVQTSDISAFEKMFKQMRKA